MAGELTFKDALGIATGYKRDMERKMAAFTRIEEVLTKAHEAAAGAQEYDRKKAALDALTEEYEKKRVESERDYQNITTKLKQDLHSLEFKVREKEAKLARLQERIQKLTITAATLEDDDKVAENG